MLRTAWWVLRQRRYASLAALMLVVALGCVAAGTWQISRYEQTARDNHALDANAHAPTVALAQLRVPLVGHGAAPGRDAIRYRTVTVSGTYLAGSQQLVRNQSLNGSSGFYVLDPLRTADGVLLVVRGFVGDGDSTLPPTVGAPPTGHLQIAGRLQTPASAHDDAAQLGHGEVESVNPAEQAARLGVPVFDAYVTLTAHQPGTAGVTALGKPDLSNPAGGAVEPQHLAYIVQWYLFALLALAAPFAIARHEVRDAQHRFLGIDADDGDFAVGPGRGAGPAEVSAGTSAEGTVAVSGRGLVPAGASTAERVKRAEQLADRYGRSLGRRPVLPADVARADLASRSDVSAAAIGARSDDDIGTAIESEHVRFDSARHPHRSPDAYHGSYNDYLWQLALADGDIATGPPPSDSSIADPAILNPATPNPATPNPATPNPVVVRADGRAVITSLTAAAEDPAADQDPDTDP